MENSSPGRKLQFVVLDLQFFGFEKGAGPNAPSSPQESWFLLRIDSAKRHFRAPGAQQPSSALKSQNILLTQKPLHNHVETLLLMFLVLFCAKLVSKKSWVFVLCDLVKLT